MIETRSSNMAVDQEEIIREIVSFQENCATTTGSIEPIVQEKQLVQDFLSKIPLIQLFQCLEEASVQAQEKQVKLICKCLDRILSSDWNGGIFFQPGMLPFIVAGLYHVELKAKQLTVNQILTHLKKKPTMEEIQILAERNILKGLVHVMADEDTGLASRASDILGQFAAFPEADLYKPVLEALYHHLETEEELTETSVEYMRYLETIANICEISDKHIEFAITIKAVDPILDSMKSKDPLFLMNVVDLIPKLAHTRLGIEHIFDSGVLNLLLSLSEDPFVGGHVIRLIGELSAIAGKLNVASWNWSDPVLSKAFISTIETKIQTSDTLQQIAAMDALAAFGSSSEKELYLLLQHKSICRTWLRLGASTKTDVKTNCFHSLARILARPTAITNTMTTTTGSMNVPDPSADIWKLNAKLFEAFGAECRHPNGGSVQYLMECLRQPFEEIRIGVFSLLRSVAAQNHEWGVRALLSYGGFFEFLMDRTTEPTKQTREWKFSIADVFLASKFQTVLDEVTLTKLKDYLKKGPYVGRAPTEMELEAA